jgi:hypothetical protein
MKKLGLKWTYGILLSFILTAIGCEQFWQRVDSQLINEFESQVNQLRELVEAHDKSVELINNNVIKFQNRQNYALLKDLMAEEQSYLANATGWMEKINLFKFLIESSEKKLRRAGINPDYARDDLVRILTLIQSNELNYKRALMIQQSVAPLLQRISKRRG